MFEELGRNIYQTWTVYDYFIKARTLYLEGKKINVILRIDVDIGLHLCPKLASILKENGINASFYFLTFPQRYYNIWESEIPKKIADMGFEVGLHTDHYYEQLVFGKDAIEGIKEDVEKLRKLVGKPFYGMVYHGHKAINALGTTNWEVYKRIPPEEFDLVYHDGLNSPYTKPESENFWRPSTTHPILSDFYRGVVGGWNYYPRYPIEVLRKMKSGESINICIHPHNAFKWWMNWDYSYNERIPERTTLLQKFIFLLKIKYPRFYRLLRHVRV